MGIEWSESSAYMKNLRKWNRPRNQSILLEDGTREYGMNAVGYEEYPRMLYKAQPLPMSQNKWATAMDRDIISLDKTTVLVSAEAFNVTCQLVVKDEQELQRALNDGWRKSQPEAMAYRESLDQAVAEAAAYRHYEDRNMSEKARAEAEKVDLSTPGQLGEIPTSDKRRAALERARAAKAAKKAAAV